MSTQHNQAIEVRGLTPKGPDEELAVRCWCQAESVMVPRRRILAGRTYSCGRRGCNEQAVAS